MKKILLLAPLLLLSGCLGKTHLVPQAHMPEPPQILMEKPRDLNTIKSNDYVKIVEIFETDIDKGDKK